MTQPAIRIENLGKRYLVKHETQRAGYRTLRESLADKSFAPLRWLRGQRSTTCEPFWALREVNLEVHPGEVVGIIGRNGAGKSTLLKILSRITKPTTGRVELNGRVGSLLEVGTGFHPELTGRENIYLNGSILGMRKAEIEKKFDEIVSFAEIEQFLDTPVKRYSSGMYVRLAFAVAAHLEPEILIIDEVLAVGDVDFQKKCLGRMRQLATQGRTVLFVSHNMPAVSRLCRSGILMKKGQIAYRGPIAEVTEQCVSGTAKESLSSADLTNGAQRSGTGEAMFTRIVFKTVDGGPCAAIPSGDSLRVELHIHAKRGLSSLVAGLNLTRSDGLPLVDLRSDRQGIVLQLNAGNNTIHCQIERLNIYPGEYLVEPWIAHAACAQTEVVDYVRDTVRLTVGPPAHDVFARFDPQFGAVLCEAGWQSTMQPSRRQPLSLAHEKT